MTSSDDPEQSGTGTPCCRLGRATERDDLQELDEALPGRWQGDGAERIGVRALAVDANRAIFAAVLQEADVLLLDDDAELLSRRLTGESVDSGKWAELRTRLESHGVDVAAGPNWEQS